MNRFLLVAVVLVLALPGPIFAAIIYTGSQPVTLTLQGGMSPPPEMAMISIAGSGDEWDDFTIILEYDMPMTSMMAMSHLAIYAPMGMTRTGMMYMSMIVGALDMSSQLPYALNLAAGDEIGPRSLFVGSAILSDMGVGQFGEDGGYIGLMLDIPGGSPHYAWLRMLSQSNPGGNTHSVTFDGRAYEDAAGRGIGAGAIPAPGALVLGTLGIGFVTWLRRRRVV